MKKITVQWFYCDEGKGYEKELRILASDHPEYKKGKRFDFGFLQEASNEGYVIEILPADEEKRLKAEYNEILDWMNRTSHPSQYSGWNDALDKLSKQWTEKENRLREVKKKLGI